MIDGPVAFAAAGIVIAAHRRDAFEKRRFAGPVLADDDGDGEIEGERELGVEQRQTEGIGARIRHK